ncbi:MAG TPA: hypothetical protein VGC97_08450 [Pyrinomonadaceae bacterium]|jgi:hypothetical protein
MKLQKIILCTAVALTAFGVGLGLFDIVNYLQAAFRPAKLEVQTVRPIPAPTVILERLTAEAEKAPETNKTIEFGGKANKTGDYYMVDKNPKGFEDFDCLEIFTHDWDEKTGRLLPVKPYGTLHAKQQDFKIERLGIKGDKISFITNVVNQVNYHFEGEFVEEKLELYNDDGTEYAPNFRIKGRLIKWQDGEKSAEARIELEVGGC